MRAHVPACFWFFANSWHDIFRNGVLDHPIKELCRLYVSRSVACEYCGNQRSVKATLSGALIEEQVLDLLNFEKSTRYDERQKTALAYAEAIVWHLNTDDAFWERMHREFSEPELVELGCMIGLTLGQQSWLRLLDIEHHEVMAGTSASMAPGYEDAQRLASTKAAPDYWAKPGASRRPRTRRRLGSSAARPNNLTTQVLGLAKRLDPTYAALRARRSAAVAQVPEQAGHDAETLAHDRCQQVFVRRVLRAAGIGVRHPDRGQAEHIGEAVIGQRAAEIGKDGRRPPGRALD